MKLIKVGAYVGVFVLGAVTARVFKRSEGQPSVFRPLVKRAIQTGAVVSERVKVFAAEVKDDFDEVAAEALSEMPPDGGVVGKSQEAKTSAAGARAGQPN